MNSGCYHTLKCFLHRFLRVPIAIRLLLVVVVLRAKLLETLGLFLAALLDLLQSS